MDPERLSASQEAAFLALLDDDNPSVRAGLVAAFARQRSSAIEFLQAVVRGPDRLLARHAAWFLQEMKCSDPVAEFTEFIRSLHYELETGLLLLNRTVAPDLDVGTCCALLDEMARRCRELIVEPSSFRDQCGVLSRVLFHEYGFRGDVESFSDPRNSLLDQVLRRRKGLPLTLSSVYLLIAQRIGLTLEPIGLPGYFMVGCFQADPPFFIDPFAQGAYRTPAELFQILKRNHVAPRPSDLAPTPVREVLCRCCRNLHHHYAGVQDHARARLFAGFVEEFEATYERHASP